ncbi:MAG: acyltransferase [Solirubrobacterales bacterium]|nr:acyltransferase [Solirubrobacterales bacterium]
MPEPVGRTGQRYMPGLDGLRAIAVIAVTLYHLQVGFAPGGLLGVGIFFTLSGYLITDILLEAWTGRRLKLSRFWLARARRLLPALISMLVIVTAWVWIGDPGQMDNLRGLVVSSTFFTSNWWVIFQDVSYFDRFGPVSPLGHLWSLAIEEQFYIVWPFILLLGLKFVPPGAGSAGSERSRLRPHLAVATLGLALVSVILMAVLYKPGFDMTRVYEGTDTRAFGLLVGAALAMVWPSRRLDGRIPGKLKNKLDPIGVASLIVLVILIWQTDQYSAFLYRGGLLLLSLATAVLVAVLAHPASRLGPIVGCAPSGG